MDVAAVEDAEWCLFSPYWLTWMCHSCELPEEFTDGTTQLVIDGDDQIAASELAQLLVTRGADALCMSDLDEDDWQTVDADSTLGGVIILGDTGFDLERVTEVIEARRGGTVRVYSYEMLFAYWFTQRDPFQEIEELSGFQESSVALQSLPELAPYFDWPTTTVAPRPRSERFIHSDFTYSPTPGLLAAAGYRRGKSCGLSDTNRRRILSFVFRCEDLNREPWVSDIGLESPDLELHIAEWGSASSPLRLMRIADRIAAFVRLEKLKDYADYSVAIEHGESDLDWLYQTYYKGKFDGVVGWWPSTQL